MIISTLGGKNIIHNSNNNHISKNYFNKIYEKSKRGKWGQYNFGYRLGGKTQSTLLKLMYVFNVTPTTNLTIWLYFIGLKI